MTSNRFAQLGIEIKIDHEIHFFQEMVEAVESFRFIKNIFDVVVRTIKNRYELGCVHLRDGVATHNAFFAVYVKNLFDKFRVDDVVIDSSQIVNNCIDILAHVVVRAVIVTLAS